MDKQKKPVCLCIPISRRFSLYGNEYDRFFHCPQYRVRLLFFLEPKDRITANYTQSNRGIGIFVIVSHSSDVKDIVEDSSSNYLIARLLQSGLLHDIINSVITKLAMTEFSMEVAIMFIGRKKELTKLNELYASDQFEFAVIYGRRRVGKSTLIQQFCDKKNFIYFVATEGGKSDNLEALSKMVTQHLLPEIQIPAFSSYEDLFVFMENYLQERLILVIDEFPYLAQSDPSLSSVIQKHIDLIWKSTKLMLILCGSSMSFMEHQVLGYKSPLYGRRSAQFKIEPFYYPELKEFHWDYSPQDMALLYAITGGVAEYLSFIDPKKSVKENIMALYLQPNGRMYEEPSNLLKQELRDPKMYHSTLNSIVSGNATLNDIATKAGELPTSASFHLKSLIELGIIKKETPIGEKETTKKSLYRIMDSSFIFWYRFIYGNQSMISMNRAEFIYEKLIEPNLSDYMGEVFESICQSYMMSSSVLENAPFFYTTIGRWWGSHPSLKRQEEIDVCAMSKQDILLGECKWTNKLIDKKVLNDLILQSQLFKQKQRHYYLFSKNGFTDAVLEEAQQNTNIHLITIDDIYQG